MCHLLVNDVDSFHCQVGVALVALHIYHSVQILPIYLRDQNLFELTRIHAQSCAEIGQTTRPSTASSGSLRLHLSLETRCLPSYGCVDILAYVFIEEF
jgi:hypothetical protein